VSAVGNGTSSGDAREPSDLGIEEAVLDALRKALQDIEYGSILLKIHQGQVVNIETSTKLRLNE
jgi:hypothetical protein